MLAVYTGTNVSSLGLIASNQSGPVCPRYSQVNFDVPATNQTYRIAVDSEPGQPGGISLSSSFVPRPSNDQFNSAIKLQGSHLIVTGSVVSATQQAGEIIQGYSNGLRTVWYTWDAPDTIDGNRGSVLLRVSGIDFAGPTNRPIVGVYQGANLATLTPVPMESEGKGIMQQILFQAQPGSTYRIVVASGETIGNGIDTSFANRLGNAPSDPLSETGSFMLRLNYSTLALRVVNVIPGFVSFTSFGKKVPFAAEAQVTNLGNHATGPLRVRLVSVTKDGSSLGDEGSYLSPITASLATGSHTFIPVAGACLPDAGVIAVLEEQADGNWFIRDTSMVTVGIGTLTYSCSIITGGGVILLEPGFGPGGTCFCPPILQRVDINGPASVNEGGTAAYWGTAYFNNGITPSFTNTLWTTTDTNRFPITTNGILSAGNVTTNTPTAVTAYFSYVGITRSTNKVVTIQNLPPPLVTNLTGLPDGNRQLTIHGVPGRQHVIEATTNLAPPVQWLNLATNAALSNGSLIYSDLASTNFNSRFYRAREQ